MINLIKMIFFLLLINNSFAKDSIGYIHMYNKLNKILEELIQEQKKCNLFSNHKESIMCHKKLDKSRIYLGEEVKKYTALLYLDRNINVNNVSDHEFLYYMIYCDMLSLPSYDLLIVSPTISISKAKCDPRLPSYEDYQDNQISPQKEYIMAHLLCKMKSSKYKDCEKINLDLYIQENKENMSKHTKSEWIPLPSILKYNEPK